MKQGTPTNMTCSLTGVTNTPLMSWSVEGQVVTSNDIKDQYKVRMSHVEICASKPMVSLWCGGGGAPQYSSGGGYAPQYFTSYTTRCGMVSLSMVQ